MWLYRKKYICIAYYGPFFLPYATIDVPTFCTSDLLSFVKCVKHHYRDIHCCFLFNCSQTISNNSLTSFHTSTVNDYPGNFPFFFFFLIASLCIKPEFSFLLSVVPWYCGFYINHILSLQNCALICLFCVKAFLST